MRNLSKIWVLLLIIAFSGQAWAQSTKLKFNGIGRSYINNASIGGKLVENDSITAGRVNNGINIIDLNFNIRPNKTNEVVALARVTNRFGGFWGSGMELEFRQLYARGIIANAIRYRAGDIYVKNSKYTTYNSIVEGSVNEAGIFHMYKNFAYYDNFHQKDRWHLQGVNLEMGLSAKSIIDQIYIDGFIGRNNEAVLLSRPERLYDGLKVDFIQSENFRFTYHHANMFEMEPIADSTPAYRNPVNTVDFAVDLGNDDMKYRVFGEIGSSKAFYKNDETVAELKGNVMDVGASMEMVKTGLTVSAGFRSVDADFRSAGAQSKRLDFSSSPQEFSQITNMQVNRGITLFDITKDQNLYATTLTSLLLGFNPKYGNVQPYGAATPNRQGTVVKANYKNTDEKFGAFLNALMLEEMRGQGTLERRSFTSIEAGADVNINKMIGMEKMLKATLGFRSEATSRGGEDYEDIDLSTSLIDFGVEYEFTNKFDILLGAKMLGATGNEFLADRDLNNTITDFTEVEYDDSELMLGAGLRYRFTETNYLSAHWFNFDYTDNKTDVNNYNISQFAILFTMKF
jgi:hypothetical protein